MKADTLYESILKAMDKLEAKKDLSYEKEDIKITDTSYFSVEAIRWDLDEEDSYNREYSPEIGTVVYFEVYYVRDDTYTDCCTCNDKNDSSLYGFVKMYV